MSEAIAVPAIYPHRRYYNQKVLTLSSLVRGNSYLISNIVSKQPSNKNSVSVKGLHDMLDRKWNKVNCTLLMFVFSLSFSCNLVS